jgi:putative oxidoreductase
MNATRCIPFAGRLSIGLAFAMSGLSKLAAYGAMVDLIASSKLPLPQPLAYAGAVMVELGCGVLMIAGYQAPTPLASSRCSAWLRRCSSIPTSPIQTRYSISSRTW